MSALPSNSVPPNLSRLAPLETAAATLRTDPGNLRRLCRDKLERQGLAMLVRPDDGGPAKWFLDRCYDRALRNPLEIERDSIPDLNHFSKRQRNEALMKWECVRRFRGAMTGSAVAMGKIVPRLIEQLEKDFPALRISSRTLYRWHRAAPDAKDIWKLADARGGNRRHLAPADAWEYFKSLFCHQNRPSARQCWKLTKRAANENGWIWCSYRACLANLNSKIAPDVQLMARDPAGYKHNDQPYIKLAEESWGAGENWISDHKQLDCICLWRKSLIRPWLTTWMDWRTRKIVGFVLSDSPNSSTILAALHVALVDESNFGGPDRVTIDNGRDYDSWLFHGQTKTQRRARIDPRVDEAVVGGILPLLGIKAHFATPYNPNGKSRLERWFRNLESFAKRFDTYTGDGVDTRPERLAEILASPALVPHFGDVQRRIGAFIRDYNNSDDHQIGDLIDDAGLRLSPAAALQKWCKTHHVMADPRALELLLQHWHKPVPVLRNGISIPLAGKTLHFGSFEPALIPFKARSKADRRCVNVSYNPADLRKIKVWDENFAFVCEVRENELGGAGVEITEDHVSTQCRRKAAYNRSVRTQSESELRSTLTDEEQIEAIAVEQHREFTEETPPMKIRRTALDGAAKQIEREYGRHKIKAAVEGEPAKKSSLPRLTFADLAAMPARRREPERGPALDVDMWARLARKT